MSDINPDGDSMPRHLTEFSGEVVFAATGPDGRELYKLTLAGDANEDGSVRFSDFLDFTSKFGGAGDWTEGDFDLDGQVTFADFLILSGNFGAGANRPSAIQVPEPNACLLIVTGIAGLLHWRRFA